MAFIDAPDRSTRLLHVNALSKQMVELGRLPFPTPGHYAS